MSRRVVLLVLDALGVGAMPDLPQCRPQDEGTNTLRSIVQNAPHLSLDHLLELGLGHIAPMDGLGTPARAPLASYGRSRLAHEGADSYLGHQEIVGTIPKSPVKTLMAEAAGELERKIAASGHAIRRPVAGEGLLLVDDAVVIGDNLEADPGLNINLTVATDKMDFEEALSIGRLVRQLVRVSRVIVFGGPGITATDILQHVEQRANGQIGVDSPALGVYNERLHVQHLGYGVDPDRQATSIVSRLGVPVVLLGKMADLIACPGATRDSIVPTPRIMEALLDFSRRTDGVLIAATVQETDLAAHEGDIARLARVLGEVDRGLGLLLPEMAPEDVLIVCADHGNDPCRNVGLHTREETPLLIYRPGCAGLALGVRPTLADIGATIAHLYSAPPTQDGSVIIQ